MDVQRRHLLVLMLLLAAAPAPSAYAQAGAAVGVSTDHLIEIGTGGEVGFEGSSGYLFGLFYDLGEGPIVLRPGLFFHTVDGIAFDLSAFPAGTTAPRFTFRLIEVPVDVRFRFDLPFIRVYPLVGPVFRFATSDDRFVGARLANPSLAAAIGFGAELPVPGSELKLFPEVRFSLGLTRFLDELELSGGSTNLRSAGQRLRSLTLGLGMAL